ncbi:polysaccharide deacetylase family protein [bacterium]|nr:polysaccharide deacetylase family protein [bacterium]
MNRINWVNFLHIYQPPWQSQGVLEQVSSESYEYLVTLFERYPNFKVSLNITGNLVEQLDDIRPDLIKRLQGLVRRGQIELTSSSKYHALLPLLNKKEISRQIELNQEILSQYFDLDKIKGFYMPEMAYSNDVAKLVKKFGFEWIILDPICYRDDVDDDILYIHKKTGLKVVFRNREVSKSYPAEVIYKHFKKNKSGATVITGTDGEIYGHFHEDWQGHLEKVLQNKNLEVSTVSHYLQTLDNQKKIDLRAASWESTESELKKKIPYALWEHPQNKVHKLLWKMVNFSSKMIDKYK